MEGDEEIMTVLPRITFWEYTKRSAREATLEFFRPLIPPALMQQPNTARRIRREELKPEGAEAVLAETPSSGGDGATQELADPHRRMTDNLDLPQEGARYGTLTSEFLRPLYEPDAPDKAGSGSEDFSESIAGVRMRMAMPTVQSATIDAAIEQGGARTEEAADHGGETAEVGSAEFGKKKTRQTSRVAQ